MASGYGCHPAVLPMEKFKSTLPIMRVGHGGSNPPVEGLGPTSCSMGGRWLQPDVAD